MNCPRCNGPADEATLREFGGVCPKCLLQFSEEQDAPAFPNLEIIEMIGQGGMGVVYKARQKNLDRLVALKVLSPHLSEDPEFVERFTREAKALAQLSHPNIVGIYDSGIHDHVPYLVMEFVDGTPLRSAMAGKLTPDRALEVIPQICDALQYAHANGIVHRDIKPENILIDRHGRVKIADFGLAKLSAEQSKLTQSGFVMGTPRYMAPEQFEPSGRVDHRADIYSLGVVFYEMLTGEVPMGRFKPPSAKAGVDQRLDPVVLKTLEREPNDRYQSANEVKEEVAGLHTRKAPSPAPSRPRESGALWKAAAVLAFAGMCALVPALLMGSLESWAGLAFLLPGGITLFVAVMVALVGLATRSPRRAASPAVPPNVPPDRMQIGGCLIALVAGGVVLLGFFFLRSSRPVPVPPPLVAPAAPPREPRVTSMTRSWTEDVPSAGDRLGVVAGPHSFLAVTKDGIREFDPDTGRLVTLWGDPVAALPVVEGGFLAVWGGGKISLMEARPNGLSLLHKVDLPAIGTVSGVAIREGTAYVAMTTGGAFAVDISSGKILWKKDRFHLNPPLLGAPVVASLDILLFSSGGREVVDRADGASKSWTQGGGGSERMIEWDQGWGMLVRNSGKVEFSSFFKKGMNPWYSLPTTSTADVDQCSLVFVDQRIVFTTVNEIHGLRRNAPFGEKWRADCPRTVGPIAPFRNTVVVVPTVEGVIFFDAESGRRFNHLLVAGQGAVSVASWRSQLLVFDQAKGRLACYKLITE